MIGIDVIPGFVEAARRAGDGDYRLLSYEELVTGSLKVQGQLGRIENWIYRSSAVVLSYIRKLEQTLHR
jgi:hypothetical protein